MVLGGLTGGLPLCRPAGWIALWRRMAKVTTGDGARVFKDSCQNPS
jgi:hypothetical protein